MGERADNNRFGLAQYEEIRTKMGSHEKGKGVAEALGKKDLHNGAYEDPGANG